MGQKILWTIFIVVSLAFFSGCVSALPKNSIKQVETIVHNQTGSGDHFIKELSEAEIQKEIDLILEEPLTMESTVKIALLKNPSIKAVLAGLGVSQADLIQAGLWHNPNVSGFIRKSNEEDRKTNAEFEVKQDVMDLIFWPLRKRLANTRFKQAEYALAKTIVDFIREVRIGFYTWQASSHMLSMRQEHFKAEESALELAQRQKQAGNINALDLEQQKGIYFQAKIDLQHSELEANIARQQLRNLLGLTDSGLEWLSQETLPDFPSEEFSLNELEEKAVANRIELAIKNQELKAVEQSLTMVRLGVIPSVAGGFNWEQETDGGRLKGPAFEAEVPVFDHKQADRLRAKAQIEAGKKQLEALEAQIRLEVRLAYDQLTSGKAMVETYLEAIPVRQQILKQTLYHYNYMLKGVYDLLRAKQEEFNTQRDYITALRDYWIARSELEHAVGMTLPVNPLKPVESQKDFYGVKQSKNQPKRKSEDVMTEHEHHQHGGGK